MLPERAMPGRISPKERRKDIMKTNYLHSIFAGLGMFGAVFLVEHGLVHTGILGSGTMLDEVLLGLFASFGLFFLLRHLDIDRELRRRQHYAFVIAELNHHIRNALQVILSRADVSIHGLAELEDIADSVNRIDWALREVLPRGGVPISEESEVAIMASPPDTSNRL